MTEDNIPYKQARVSIIVESIKWTLQGKGYVVATMTEDNILGGQSKYHHRKHQVDTSRQGLCGGHNDRR